MLRQVVVRPELAEHLMTTGDIGVPISALCKRFPLVRPPGGGIASDSSGVTARSSKHACLVMGSCWRACWHLLSNGDG